MNPATLPEFRGVGRITARREHRPPQIENIDGESVGLEIGWPPADGPGRSQISSLFVSFRGQNFHAQSDDAPLVRFENREFEISPADLLTDDRDAAQQ